MKRHIFHLPHPAHDHSPQCASLLPKAGGRFTPLPPAGSDEEMAETALRVGYPGAFGMTSGHVERHLSRLLWES
jgi:hypothetical protein